MPVAWLAPFAVAPELFPGCGPPLMFHPGSDWRKGIVMAKSGVAHEPALREAFAKPRSNVLADLDVDPSTGLDDGEVAERLERYGRNEQRKHETKSITSILIAQVRSVIVWLLFAAATVSLFIGDWPEAIAIIVVLVINTAIGFFTEWRAIRSMEALRSMSRVTAHVRRNGRERDVEAQEIVPGDIVLLAAGNVVPADVRLVKISDLQCDESALTGESVPVSKTLDPLHGDVGTADRTNTAFKGTSVSRGSGEGVVTATGMATELGRIAELTQTAEGEIAPLERRLDRLGRRLVWLTLALAAATALAGIVRGRDLLEMLETSIALAVAAVPEGLPVVATLCLARGMWRMANRNALVSKLSAVETLGATTTIMADKTGTLTENRMTVVRYLLPSGSVDIAWHSDGGGDGDSTARFERDGEELHPRDEPEIAWALKIGALCNGAKPARDEGATGSAGAAGAKGAGDPMEIALLQASRAAGLDQGDLLRDLPQKNEHPFDADLKMMATVHRENGAYLIAVKGAPEVVLDHANAVRQGDEEQELDEDTKAEWRRAIGEAARSGYRLLGLAMRKTSDANAEPYQDLTLIGFVCLLDPVRADVPDAIAACRRARVKVVMMTGDHADTAREIARQAGFGDRELRVMEGKELRDIGSDSIDREMRKRILGTDVFARVSPEIKMKIANFHQEDGHIVAMTGDGVNDAPALKKADIGIAMGQRGTEVAREASDMVLQDDAFPTIVAAMREGRVIMANIRKFVTYLLSCNASEILVVGLAVLSGLPTPLLPLQILYLNLVTDVFPAFALGLGEGDETVMQQPPRDPQEPVVDREHWLRIAGIALLITTATLGAYTYALFNWQVSTTEALTISFVTLAFSQIWNVFNMRSMESGLFVNEVTRNPWVWGAVPLCIGLTLAATLLPGLSKIMGLTNLTMAGWGLALFASLVPLVLGQLAQGVFAQFLRGARPEFAERAQAA